MKSRSLVVFMASCLAILLPVTARAYPMIDPPIADPSGAGLTLYASSTDPIVATYLGNSARYSNDLYLTTGDDGHTSGDRFVFNNHASDIGSTIDLGSFAVGTPLTFRMHVNNTGRDYVLGAADLNPDNQIHARVQDGGYQGQTLVSFEDLFNGPFNFNDLSFALTNVTTTPIAGDPPTSVPEPAPLALMGAGMIALGLVKVRTGGRRVAP